MINDINNSPENYATTKEAILRFSTQLLRYIPWKDVRSLIKRILWEIHDIKEERWVFIQNQWRMLRGFNGNERYPNGNDISYNDLYKGQPQAIRSIQNRRKVRRDMSLRNI
jgi:hypothetical protein